MSKKIVSLREKRLERAHQEHGERQVLTEELVNQALESGRFEARRARFVKKCLAAARAVALK